jgi:hypothetical protein
VITIRPVVGSAPTRYQTPITEWGRFDLLLDWRGEERLAMSPPTTGPVEMRLRVGLPYERWRVKMAHMLGRSEKLYETHREPWDAVNLSPSQPFLGPRSRLYKRRSLFVLAEATFIIKSKRPGKITGNLVLGEVREGDGREHLRYRCQVGTVPHLEVKNGTRGSETCL